MGVNGTALSFASFASRIITRRDGIGELRFPIVPELFINRSRVRSLDRNDWMVSDRMCDAAAGQDGRRR